MEPHCRVAPNQPPPPPHQTPTTYCSRMWAAFWFPWRQHCRSCWRQTDMIQNAAQRGARADWCLGRGRQALLNKPCTDEAPDYNKAHRFAGGVCGGGISSCSHIGYIWFYDIFAMWLIFLRNAASLSWRIIQNVTKARVNHEEFLFWERVSQWLNIIHQLKRSSSNQSGLARLKNETISGCILQLAYLAHSLIINRDPFFDVYNFNVHVI